MIITDHLKFNKKHCVIIGDVMSDYDWSTNKNTPFQKKKTNKNTNKSTVLTGFQRYLVG